MRKKDLGENRETGKMRQWEARKMEAAAALPVSANVRASSRATSVNRFEGSSVGDDGSEGALLGGEASEGKAAAMDNLETLEDESRKKNDGDGDDDDDGGGGRGSVKTSNDEGPNIVF